MNKELYTKMSNFTRLISLVANIDAATLDIKALLDVLPEAPAGVGDELQQISDLSKTVAQKLEINEQVSAVRDLQEAGLKADQSYLDSFKNAVEAFRSMCECEDCNKAE